MALALGVNLLLLLVLLGLGVVPLPEKKPSRALIVDLIPESHDAAAQPSPSKAKPRTTAETKPVPKPPPIILPVKPTIRQPDKPLDMVEMSKDELAAADIRNVPKASAGDSEEVGRGPHGEVLYAAEWAREPTDAEISGYLSKNAQSGWGMVACKTIPGNRVEDCIELENHPAGSHLASTLRQAAWQFRVRPPRKNGRALVGEWVRIRFDLNVRSE
jgi:hypothetical protein